MDYWYFSAGWHGIEVCWYSTLTEMRRKFVWWIPKFRTWLIAPYVVGLIVSPSPWKAFLTSHTSLHACCCMMSGLWMRPDIPLDGQLWEDLSGFTCCWHCVMFPACDIANLASCPPVSSGKSKQFKQSYRLLINTWGFVFCTVELCAFLTAFVLRC